MTKELFINAALQFLNTPYRWGGDDPSGIDCSGLVQEMLAMIGLDPKGDQTADALYRHFRHFGNEGILGAGSLVFFGSEAKVTHVAIMLDEFTMLEAGGGGSRTKTTQDAWDQNAFVRLRPFNMRLDLVTVIQPHNLPF